MKAAINPYIKDPIEQGDLICANDVQELRDNVEKLLQFFHEHIGSTVNEYGYDSYPEIRQHAVVTEASNGFAPYTIFKDLDDYKQKYDLLNASFNSDPFPALSIVAWGGDYNDILPEGWIFCDGESVLYEDPENPKKVYYSPDLRYVEPVSVSPSRRFLSRMTGIDRSSATTADGTGVTKYYIIKKPNTYTPPEEPKALLTVIQPKGVRIATNCTTSDREKLFKRKDGSMETVELPYGTDITISTFDSDEYIFEKGKDKLYIKENSKSEKETLRTNTFKLQEDTEVTATSTYDRYTLTLVQPKQVRIYTDEIPKSSVIGLPDGASTSAEVERGNTITISNVDSTQYKLTKLNIQRAGESYKTSLSGNKFTLSSSTTVTADVELKEFTFKIKGTEHQTITVVCGGVSHTSTTNDVTFLAYSGEAWTATIAPEEYYTAGTLSATSGTISGNVEISATAATKKITHKLAVTAVHGNSHVYDISINGENKYGPATLWDNTGKPTFDVSVGDNIEVTILCNYDDEYGPRIFYLDHGYYPEGKYYPYGGTITFYNRDKVKISTIDVPETLHWYSTPSNSYYATLRFAISASHRYDYAVEVRY